MLTTKNWCVVTALVFAFSLACGGKKKGGDEIPKDPKKLGDKIGKDFAAGMKEAGKILEGHPPIDQVKPKIVALRDATIAKMVASGKVRESLEAAGKQACDQAIMAAFGTLSREEFNVVADASKHYRASDNDFANMIVSLNTITQYANFDLLKKQLPDEAKRLGIQ
jgi:hypothetical protein